MRNTLDAAVSSKLEPVEDRIALLEPYCAAKHPRLGVAPVTLLSLLSNDLLEDDSFGECGLLRTTIDSHLSQVSKIINICDGQVS